MDAITSEDTLVFFSREAGGQPEPKDGFRFLEITSDMAPRYSRDIGTDSSGTFTARLSPSTRCFGVEADGLLVHSSWVTTAGAWTRELRRLVTPPAHEAYVYESFTRPEARGHGIYPFALASICGRLAEEKIQALWVAAEDDNPASIRAITKAGFEERFRVSYRRRVGTLHVDAPTSDIGHVLLSGRN